MQTPPDIFCSESVFYDLNRFDRFEPEVVLHRYVIGRMLEDGTCGS